MTQRWRIILPVEDSMKPALQKLALKNVCRVESAKSGGLVSQMNLNTSAHALILIARKVERRRFGLHHREWVR